LTSSVVGIYFFAHSSPAHWTEQRKSLRAFPLLPLPGAGWRRRHGPGFVPGAVSIVPPPIKRRIPVNFPLRFVPLVLGMSILLLAGCGLRPQNIKLDPPVQVEPSQIGQGKVVWVQVRDARLRKTLGNVGDADGKFTQVSVEGDFSTLVYQRVSSGLRDLGFVAQPTPGPEERSLIVEVRELKYESLKRTLTFATEVSVSVAGMARNGVDHYDRVYNAGEQKTGPLMPSENERAETVNRLAAVAIEDMLNDPRLTGLLAQ
jgi:uncharacterized lipoprotein YajG